MSNLKYSPGPWRYDGGTAILAENGFQVATIYFSRSRGKEGREEDVYSRGNANAISAVPDMIEALEAIVEADIDSIVDAGDLGSHRTDHVCLGCGSSFEHGEGCPIPLVSAALSKAKGNQ